MELTLIRKAKSDTTTLGQLLVNSHFTCYTLEDKDRDLVQTMKPADIAKIKVHAKTAIPKGRYQVVITFSNRFQKDLPLLVNVPGYEGVRIHSGNTDKDTEGCILVGYEQNTDWVGQSRMAMTGLMALLHQAVIKKEQIFITIQ
ncbi:DUF5675 family protein [Mucilaginibacter sp. CSA2-8R]|uniref:DUF5675 family protein n=1 Tax=Mucilaginibacter sp. CSA2-8R TaxID=3141542 RepID=UPI00315DFAD4